MESWAIKQDGDIYTFTSGRALYANQGIIGLDNAGNVGGGYDQMIYWPRYYEYYDIEGSTEGLVELVDLIELADLMIDRWTTFKAGPHQNKSPESS